MLHLYLNIITLYPYNRDDNRQRCSLAIICRNNCNPDSAIPSHNRFMSFVIYSLCHLCFLRLQTTTDTVVWGCFHPQDHSQIITYGKRHIYFWKLFWEPVNEQQGRILRDKKSGNFDVRRSS